MTHKSLKYLNVAAIVLVAACVVREKKVAVIQREWPVGAVNKITLHEVHGNVSVTAAPGLPVTLVARVRYGGEIRNELENRGLFDSSLEGKTLRLNSLRGSRGAINLPFMDGHDVSIDYKLSVPPETELDLHTVNGEIDVHGITARASVNSVNGGVRIETDGTSSLNARTVNGSVNARFVKKFIGAKVATVNGRVHIILPADSSFVCDLTQVNGGFESNFPLSIRSSNGNREVTSVVNGGKYMLMIKTVNGEVDLTREGSPSIASAESASIDGNLVELPAIPEVPEVPEPEFEGIPEAPVAPELPAAPPSPAPRSPKAPRA